MTEPFKLPLHIELPMTKKYAGPLMVFDADGGYLFLAWPHVAEPIVRMVNAHDRLVAALRKARSFAQAELDVRLDSFCLKGPDGKPDIATLGDEDSGACSEAMLLIHDIDVVLLAEIDGERNDG